MRTKILILIMAIVIVSLIGISTMVNAAPDKRTGFHVYVEQYGFELISYEISDRFSYIDDNSEKFVTLDIIVEKNEQLYSYSWIMTKEKYLERREKV